jgi:hypothetical protein
MAFLINQSKNEYDSYSYYEIDKKKVYFISTDNASYCKLACNILQNKYEFINMDHITCWSHVIHLSSGSLISSLPVLKEFLTSFNVLFRFGKAGSIYFDLFNCPHPKACETRWGLFLLACKIHHLNFNNYKELINKLEKSNGFNNKSESFKLFKKIVFNVNNELKHRDSLLEN